MLDSAVGVLKGDRSSQVLVGVFVLLAIWWALLQTIGVEPGGISSLAWAASYQVIALMGGIFGIAVGRMWGGFKSVMGRSIFAFSVGLLFQTFGQSVFSLYNLFLKVEVPYPSLADVGFFGSIPIYIYGIILLARASGAQISLRSFINKIQALLIPLVMLILSYYFFLRGYEFDWSDPLRIFLDFGYPMGQAVYVSIAILTYMLSKKFLGGIMRAKVLFILFALVVQYFADYNFLYQAINETWVNGGYGDLVYLVAYLLMALGLLQLKTQYLRSDL